MSDSHLDTNRLLASIESGDGESGSSRPADTEHLAGCVSCSGRLEDLRHLLAAFDAARLPELSPALVESTLARLREEFGAGQATDRIGAAIAAIAERLGHRFREIRGFWNFDTLIPSQQFRGGVRANTWLYRTDEYELVIGVGEAGETALRGQVIPRVATELPQGSRALLARADTVLEATISEMGEFSFDPAPSDPASLAILLGEDMIRVDIP